MTLPLTYVEGRRMKVILFNDVLSPIKSQSESVALFSLSCTALFGTVLHSLDWYP